jgi:hypothetical protein
MIFEMMSGLEMHIIYCAAFVGMIVRRQLARMMCIMANESYVINFGLAEASASYAENPGVWTSSSYSYKLIVDQLYRSPSSAKALHSESINTYKASSHKESGQPKDCICQLVRLLESAK